MKKAFRSVLAFMLVFVIMASVFCTAGVLAASDTVYTAHLHGTGNATLATEKISVGTETTYTVSFRWKSVQGNARVQLSGSAIGGRTVDLIVEGSYPKPGITYDWRNGTVAYTFTTPKDAKSDTLVFSALQYSAEETEFYIGDVKIFESDANGAAVKGGEVIDLPFVNGDFTWAAPDAAYIDYAEQETGFFALESDPNDGVEKLLVFTMPDNWDERSFNKNVTVTSGKTYTFKMYFKALSNANTGNIQVAGKYILTGADVVYDNDGNVTEVYGGKYHTANGAVYDGYTGLVTYTFTAPSDSIYINMENRLGQGGKHKHYAIAMPQLFESDENGAAVEGGEVIDCDVSFGSWNYDFWSPTTLPDGAGVEFGSKDFFATKFHDQQPDDGIYVMQYKTANSENWNRRYTYYTTEVTPNTEYTFSMYYRDLGSSAAHFLVNDTLIINGGYDVQGGAVYDKYTGKVTYKFTTGENQTTVTIAIDSSDDSYKYKNFKIADPRLLDSNGNDAGCNVDFYYWKSEDNTEFTVTIGHDYDFPTVDANEQPENGVYILSYKNDDQNRRVEYTTMVTAGKEYTFSMYYKNLGNDKTVFQLGSFNILNGGVAGENVVYDTETGKVTYTFTPDSGSVKVAIESRYDVVGLYKNFLFADPRLVSTDGTEVIPCCINFSRWTTTDWGGTLNGDYTVYIGKYTDFMATPPSHEQPGDGKVYVGTFNEWFEDGAVDHSVNVETGKTYTFSMLYKFITAESENVLFTLSGSAVGEKVILANNADPVSAEYDPLTGRYSYTFTAQGDTLTIALQNSSIKVRTIYMIADPQMTDSDGNSVDCDVDFCEWNTDGLYNRHNYFNITTDYASGFGVNLITGDANADGAFNIADLVAAKKYLSNARSWLSFKALNTTKTDISADTLAAVRRWLLNGAEVLSKQEVMNKLTVAASSKYLLGAHTAGNTDVPACADSFSAVMGAAPGYIDVDMHSLPFISGDATNRIVSDVTAYAMQGTGFVTLSAHWLTPTTKIADATLQGANNSRTMLTTEQYNNVMTAGTTENTNFLEELAIDAAFIRKLKDNGISVIFRSMHEGNQGYFWWCVNPEQGITTAMYSNLYRYVHDYFTVTCGLDNIIWQFNVDRAGYNAETVAAMYPGDNYVDTVSLDWYLSSVPTTGAFYEAYTSLMSISGNKPFAIAEFGGYGDYPIYETKFSETLKKIDDACTMGAKIAYVGPYVNWGDIKN